VLDDGLDECGCPQFNVRRKLDCDECQDGGCIGNGVAYIECAPKDPLPENCIPPASSSSSVSSSSESSSSSNNPYPYSNIRKSVFDLNW
jgi:hypothetical protein